MKCPKIARALCEYLDREAGPKMKEWVKTHSKKCRPCQAFLNSLKVTMKAIQKQPKESPSKKTRRKLREKLNNLNKS